MPRFKLTIAYIGTAYKGFQRQLEVPTVQGALEIACEKIFNTPICIFGASRTDAGVHASGQVAHFDALTTLTPPRLLKAINTYLPPDISIVQVEEVDTAFHATFDALWKRYAYYFYISPVPYAPFENGAWRIPKALNIEAMNQAAAHLIGHHNFRSFTAADSTAKTFEREIYEVKIEHQETPPFPSNDLSPPVYRLEIRGKGFLKFMIRNIMGTLIEVGREKRSPAQFGELIALRDRRKAGSTAPAKGLFLEKIAYR